MQKQKGFTIIELIVVIAIIAVLAAIILVNVNGYIRKSKLARFKAEAHQMTVALNIFYSKYNKWPEEINGDYTPPVGDLGENFSPEIFPNWDASYMGKAPDGLAYQYDYAAVSGGCAYLYIMNPPQENSYGFYNVNCADCPDSCGMQDVSTF